MPYLSNPSTPAGDGSTSSPGYPFPAPINTNVAGSGAARQDTPTGGTPTTGAPFRPRHGRQPSLGTTMTSPSNRRRSIESTISLIREASEGKGVEEAQLRQMAETIAGTGKPTYNYAAAAPPSG
jgi:serine/threonine-protein phosphatase 2B catalytic subunit